MAHGEEDLRGRGEDEAHVVARRRAEHDVAAADVAKQGLERAVADQLHADRGGEVKATVRFAHQRIDELRIRGRALDQLSGAGVDEVSDVLAAAGAEVVEQHDILPGGHQGVRQMRADEACSPRDQVFHAVSPSW